MKLIVDIKEEQEKVNVKIEEAKDLENATENEKITYDFIRQAFHETLKNLYSTSDKPKKRKSNKK